MRFNGKQEWAATALLFALAALYFLPVLLKGNSQVLSSEGNDVWAQYFYWRHFGFSSLARGEIPLWNPYIFSGAPFVAGMQSAIFYPLNALFLLFDAPLAINLSIALHCFLGSLFTYLFARTMELGRPAALLSAVSFAYGAPYFLHIYPGHLSNLSTMIWLPLVLLTVEAFLRTNRLRYAILGGMALSMQVFAGHAQYLFYSVIAVSLYFFLSLWFRREVGRTVYRLGGFCLFALTGVLLSAVQLIPTLELTRYSVREALSYQWVADFSFPPKNLVTLLLPDFFGDIVTVPHWGDYHLWEMSVYLGLVPLAMAAAAVIFARSRAVLIFSLIAVAALVLALGRHTPLLGLLYAYVPGFNLFRGLSKFVFVFAFAGSMLAGYGLDRLVAPAGEADAGRRRFVFCLSALALLLVVAGTTGWLRGEELKGFLERLYERGPEAEYTLPLTGEFFRAALNAVLGDLFKAALILLLLGALLFAGSLKRLPAKPLAVSLVALTLLDLWSFGARYLKSFNREILSVDRELKAFLKSDTEPFRIATPIFALLDAGLREEIENVGGYDAIILKHYNEFINLTQRLPINQLNADMGIGRHFPLLALLNVKYYIFEFGAGVELPDLEPVFQNGRYKVYRDNLALPRAFIVHDALVARERETVFRELTRSTFDPTLVAIVEEAIEGPVLSSVEGLPRDQSLRSPAPRFVERSPRSVVLEAELAHAGLLVLGDAYYPGWKAFVDGREAKIYRANYVMRGLFLPAGRHRVEFRYEPLSFQIGALISLASVVLVVGFLLRSRIRG